MATFYSLYFSVFFQYIHFHERGKVVRVFLYRGAFKQRTPKKTNEIFLKVFRGHLKDFQGLLTPSLGKTINSIHEKKLVSGIFSKIFINDIVESEIITSEGSVKVLGKLFKTVVCVCVCVCVCDRQTDKQKKLVSVIESREKIISKIIKNKE